MKIKNMIFSTHLKTQLILLPCSTFCFNFSQAAMADSEILKGSVQEEDAITRLARPSNNNGKAQSGSLRIDRPTSAPLTGLVDTDKFSNPLSGNLKSDSADLGLVQPDKFQNLSANKFDVGADRGSRELMIGWERWYKQLSGAIYGRWSQVADIPGHAIVRITVTNERELTAILVKSSGSSAFDSGLVNAILTLNGNPGLTFPVGSQRKSVSLESDYIAGTNIEPGYNWIRNDYEKVQESY
jgi:hypothetical protein